MRALLKSARLRANPAYELVPVNRLPDAERRSLANEEPDPDTYGVLRAAAGGELATLVVDRETALLFLTLQQPGPLPDYVEAVFGREGERGLERLLLDRVLEVAGPDGFVGGAAAAALLGLDTPLGEGRLARLSQQALRYGQALELADPRVLAMKLYRYNQRPATPRWRRRIPDRQAAAGFLGLQPGGANEAPSRRGWRAIEAGEGWLSFAPNSPRAEAAGTRCKLYVSPAPEALPEVLTACLTTLADCGARQLKVGGDLYGLLRPDKLVAYFGARETLLAAAEMLRRRLEGTPVQGVPFTAEAGGSLLSWGSDPRRPSETGGMSWRHWLVNRLAAALVSARQAPPGAPEPWRFALERIALEGVDPKTFGPTAVWSGEPGR